MRKSLSSMRISTSSASGSTATVAAEVWIRPAASVSGTRWTRCTPDSNLSLAKTSRPLIKAVASLNPPRPVSERSRISNRHPRNAAYLWYMRKSSAANNAASSPPVPARTSRIALRSSSASFGKQRQLHPLFQIRQTLAQRLQLFLGKLPQVSYPRSIARDLRARITLRGRGATARSRQRSGSARCIPSTISRNRRP